MTINKLPEGTQVEEGEYKDYTHEIYYISAFKRFTVWITTKFGTRSQIGIASSLERGMEMYDAFYLSKNL